MPRWIDENGITHDYNYEPPAPEIRPELSTAFQKPKKTLKLEPINGTSLASAVNVAYANVTREGSDYNRIEFKFGRCYIVVAKLKD